MSNISEQFRNAITSAGFQAPPEIESDGLLRHYITGRADFHNAFYILKSNGYGVFFCNIRTGVRMEWRAGS
jgi:hypothetical protein